MAAMKKLYLVTTGFPYPAKSMETYLETETQYYDSFDEVNIISLGVRRKTLGEKRTINCKCKVNIFPIVFGTKMTYIINGICAFFDRNFYREILELWKERKLNFRRLIRLIIYISRAHFDARRAIKTMGLDKKATVKDAVIYSYRFEYQPYVALLLARYFDNPTLISRAHRYDLYEERNCDQYIPARRLLLKEFNKVYLISQDGYDYLADKFPEYKGKMAISRLGTLDNGIEKCENKGKSFRIVSCSNLVPIKRVDRIISTLSKIKTQRIEWVHFGSGEEESKIKKMASETLGENVNAVFEGRVENRKVLEFYRNNAINLFINLSDSEGIPVSIMEAMSFGIPCIATNVGGTSEIVVNGINGYLIDDEDDEYIAGKVDSIATMNAEGYRQLRDAARNTWEQKFNAKKNYRVFIEEIKNI